VGEDIIPLSFLINEVKMKTNADDLSNNELGVVSVAAIIVILGSTFLLLDIDNTASDILANSEYVTKEEFCEINDDVNDIIYKYIMPQDEYCKEYIKENNNLCNNYIMIIQNTTIIGAELPLMFEKDNNSFFEVAE